MTHPHPNSHAMTARSAQPASPISGNTGVRIYDLPIPPSVNNLYFNSPRGGRVKTERYRKWIHAGRWALLAQKARPIAGKVSLHILVSDKSRADLENHAKAAIDLFVAHGVLEDDCKQFVRAVSLEWSDHIEGIRVTIKPAK